MLVNYMFLSLFVTTEFQFFCLLVAKASEQDSHRKIRIVCCMNQGLVARSMVSANH